jgi:hypothetical protein
MHEPDEPDQNQHAADNEAENACISPVALGEASADSTRRKADGTGQGHDGSGYGFCGRDIHWASSLPARRRRAGSLPASRIPHRDGFLVSALCSLPFGRLGANTPIQTEVGFEGDP